MAKKRLKSASDIGAETPEVRSKSKKEMTVTELLSFVDNELKNALGKSDTRLSSQRLQAMKYYLGDKDGNLTPPEAEGRSSVVSMDVSDTIEWILPSLLRIFTSGDKAVEFSPKKPGDEQGANQATEWCNHVFYTQNEGFIILHDWFKDALLQKLGIVKTWWDDSKDITTEEYEGLSLEELTLMLQDGTVEVIQKTENTPEYPAGAMAQPPAPTYDVKIKRTRDSSHTCIENVPPEEWLVSRKARTPQRIFSCHHRLLRTVTELKEAGYKNTDDLMSDDSGAEFSQESVERDSDTNKYTYSSQITDSGDPTMRLVWITESYMQVDWDGDGLAEWRKIVKCGKVLLDNEEIDEHPFSLLTPIKMPHKLVGRSVADLLMDIQDIKTALFRQNIDNMYLTNNPRTYVDETKSVNIDDLLDNRIGGIVRGKGENAIVPIEVAPLSPTSFTLLDYIDKVRDNRTGVNDTAKGLDADTLNQTAITNRNQLVSAAQAKVELIARIFAETGVKDLFRRILKQSAQYQKKQQVIRLTNKFVTVDPRAWKTQYDIVVNVGLGTGNKDQIASHLMGVLQLQEKAIQGGLPIVSAKQIYNAASKYAVNIGFKDADQFFVDPDSEQGQQLAQQAAQKPNPEMAKVQGQLQLEQAKNQSALQIQQAQYQADTAMEQQRSAAETQKQQNEHALEVMRIQAEAQLKAAQHNDNMALERERAANDYKLAVYKGKLDSETKIIVAQIGAQTQVPDLSGIDRVYQEQMASDGIDPTTLNPLPEQPEQAPVMPEPEAAPLPPEEPKEDKLANALQMIAAVMAHEKVNTPPAVHVDLSPVAEAVSKMGEHIAATHKATQATNEALIKAIKSPRKLVKDKDGNKQVVIGE